MVSKPTVLIVGAGGSMPYGYPSGRQLVENILTRLLKWDRAYSKNRTTENYYGYSREQLFALRNRLTFSQLNSIDAFLGKPNHKEFVHLGKLLIAEELVRFENPIVRPVDDPEQRETDDWYRYLINRLADNISAGKDQPLTILTYNYDRSLDYALRTSLQSAFSFSDDELGEKLGKLRIIHLHGQLSKLPVPVAQGVEVNADYLAEFRHYGLFELPGLIPRLAEGIKIVHENGKNEGVGEDAEQALLEATRVCFLGFSYNELNMIPLCRRKWSSGCDVLGSRFGLVDSEINRAREYLGESFQFGDDSKEKCVQTLRRFSSILS